MNRLNEFLAPQFHDVVALSEQQFPSLFIEFNFSVSVEWVGVQKFLTSLRHHEYSDSVDWMIASLFVSKKNSEFEVISYGLNLLIFVEVEDYVAPTFLLTSVRWRLVGSPEARENVLNLWFQAVEVIRQLIDQAVERTQLDLDIPFVFQELQRLWGIDLGNWLLGRRIGRIVSGRRNHRNPLNPKVIFLLFDPVDCAFLVVLEKAPTVVSSFHRRARK